MNPTQKQDTQSTPTNTDTNMDIKDLETIKKSIMMLAERVIELEETIKKHNHTGKDGTPILENSLNLKPSEDIQMGNFRLQEASDIGGSDFQRGILVVGKDKEDTLDSTNMEVVFEHQANTNGSTNQSFIYAFRHPLKTGFSGSVSSGGSTFSTAEIKFETDGLVGAQLVVYSSDLSTFDSKTIIANTSNTITISGTWSFDNSSANWIIGMPVYNGSASTPWRQVYAGGEDVSSDGSGAQRRAIRLGYGVTSSSPGIYFGTGVPDITAANGSLFLRTDGTSAAGLYIREAGAWSAR